MSNFYRVFTLIVCCCFFSQISNAAICKKALQLSIKMSDDWYKKEELRKQKEEILLSQYSKYISKEIKNLQPEEYYCPKGTKCDAVKNCQMEKDVKDFRDEEYLIRSDSGIVIAKSHCSVIGKCIGYNDFYHTDEITAAEDRLVDVKRNHAVFHHYFYSAKSNYYEHPFNLTSFATGHELYFDSVPHFSPDDKVIVEVHSVAESENLTKGFPKGFAIKIYEFDNSNEEYKIVETSDFLERNPSCGKTPYFHSWKSDREARLTLVPPYIAKTKDIIVLYFDNKLNKWTCKEDEILQPQCEYYLPDSVNFVSNITTEQIKSCRQSTFKN